MYISVVLALSSCLFAFALVEERNIFTKVLEGPGCYPKPVSEVIPLCANLGYNYTAFPNYRGLNEADTILELSDLKPLIRTNCSNAILHLLCSIYAPPCMPTYPGWKYPPCRALCQYVENGCATVFKVISGYDWPPNSNLNCSKYTTYERNHLSFCPPDPKKLRIPQSKKVDESITNPPKNFTATVVSPSTVDFSWQPPDNDEHEVYYLTCEPHIVPVRTKKTAVRASHFTPNTNYSCQVLLAHAKNIKALACTVTFTTGVIYPPLSIKTKNINPFKVELSWKHKDKKHQRKMRTATYKVSCRNKSHSIENITSRNKLILNHLTPGTRYSCNISLLPPLSEYYERANISFTTLEILTVNFVENTPAIDGRQVSVKINISRNASKMICQILGHSKKQKVDCSNSSATFYDLSPGSYYTVRIVAENNRNDRIVIREKIFVSDCGVKLKKISKTGRSVTIFFRGTNSANKFQCSLDNQELFECSSPLYLSNYPSGVHTLMVVPTSNWCHSYEDLSTAFTI